MYTLNLATIRSELKGKIHNSSLSNTKIDRWANITQDYIWTHADLKSAITEVDFNCVASQETYYINANIGRILSITNITNQCVLTEISEKEMNNIDPTRDEEGVPERFSLFGKSEVKAQNSVASQVTVTSSSAADTTQSVRVIGNVSDVETAESISLNGVAAVNSVNTFDINGVIGVRLSGSCTGNITVTAGVTTLVVIPSGKFFMMYQPIKLGPLPSSTDSLRVTYLQGPRPMISEYDIPDLPPEFHSLIILGTLAQAHDEMYEFDVAEIFYNKLDKQIDNLRKKDASIRGDARTIKVRGLRPYKGAYGVLPIKVTGI